MLVFEFPPLLYLSPSLVDLVIVEGEEVRDGEDEVLEDHATAALRDGHELCELSQMQEVAA